MTGFLVGWGVFWFLFWLTGVGLGLLAKDYEVTSASLLLVGVSVIFLIAVGVGLMFVPAAGC